MARLGLQGKLILCFLYMLAIVLGTSCWIFGRQSSMRVSGIMGEQARQISYALSLASKPLMESGQTGELKRIGADLLKTRNIVFVCYLDRAGKSIALSSHDPDFNWEALSPLRNNTQALMQIHHQHSPVMGDYLAVMSPILTVPASVPSTGPAASDKGAQLLGYVVVGLSQHREQQQLSQINYVIIGAGILVIIMVLPLSYAIVHRIFLPIRQLVDATLRIAGGDLETHVAIHRPDLIGTLARSFNEMVQQVRSQQEALENANIKLADTNLQLADANDLLARANDELEEKVQERTAQLEAANNRLSHEIAEKEDFLRAVSHDLNAPLRNISGMASMLLIKHRDKFDEDIVHRLERIQKNVDVETELISELLELSRIKTRRQSIEPVDIKALVLELGEVLENDLRSKAISLLIDNPLPVIEGEKARLRQVFQNLIDNAIKYMGDGPVRQIHVGSQLRAGEAEFYVRDTGLGIDPEDIGKVFFIFRRGKGAATQNVAGKGVGLASVKSIIQTYDGAIRVESQPGNGSTFRFTINGKYVPAIRSTPSPLATQSAA